MFACNVDLDVCAHVHLHACVHLFICICIGLVGKGIQTKTQSQPMHHWQFCCEQICGADLQAEPRGARTLSRGARCTACPRSLCGRPRTPRRRRREPSKCGRPPQLRIWNCEFESLGEKIVSSEFEFEFEWHPTESYIVRNSNSIANGSQKLEVSKWGVPRRVYSCIYVYIYIR